MYLTLPKEEIETIKLWIYKYFENDTEEFPYKGEIPNADVSFTIDFDRDVRIERAHDLKYEMSEYNKEHNAQHNRDIAYNKVKETFSRLVGNEWTRAEIIQQGFNHKNLDNFVKYRFIERIARGQYKRLLE